MKAIKLAMYIVSFFDHKGDLITNKKLQKLIYYVEAWNLVFLDSIYDENIEAWVHGPVVREVYNEYKKFGYSQIIQDYPEDSSASKELEKLGKALDINGDKKELIETVLEKYGAMSSFQLELLVHQERPWLEAREGLGPTDKCNKHISRDTMKKYYSSLIHAKEKKEKTS